MLKENQKLYKITKSLDQFIQHVLMAIRNYFKKSPPRKTVTFPHEIRLECYNFVN